MEDHPGDHVLTGWSFICKMTNDEVRSLVGPSQVTVIKISSSKTHFRATISILPTVLVCLSLVGGLVFLLLLIREQFVRLTLSDDQTIDPWPVVSIIVPARNEADSIEEALKSVLALDYPNKEIIVINDRSTDATGEILARLAQEYPELQLITIDRLPSGWLGKNHALQRGAVSASGELLLFTDADIIMQPSLLRRRSLVSSPIGSIIWRSDLHF